jgi:Tfp pilus assembly protein PilN
VLKINLLPSYIYEGRNKMIALVGMIVLVLAVTAGMLYWNVQEKNKANALQIQVDAMEANAKQVSDLQAQVTAEQGRIPDVQGKVKFIEDLRAYNLGYPALYEKVARYTYSRVNYTSMQISSGQLKIKAHARSLGDCGRYLLNMYRGTDLFKSVTISGIPSSWTHGQVIGGFDFDVTCGLVSYPVAPAAPAGTVALSGGSSGSSAAPAPAPAPAPAGGGAHMATKK